MTTQKAVGDILKNLICDNGKLVIEAPVTAEKVEVLKNTILQNAIFEDKGVSLPPITDAMITQIAAGGSQCQTAIDGLVKDVIGTTLKEEFNDLVADTGFIDQILDEIDRNKPTLTATTITPASCGLNNGSVKLSATGGTPPYQYSKDGTTFQSTDTFEALAVGKYTFYVKDSKGEKGNLTVFVKNEDNNVERSTYEPIILGIANARLGGEPLTVRWDATTTPYTFTPKAGVTLTRIGNGKVQLSTTNAEDKKWEGTYGVYFKKNDHNTFIGFYNETMSGICTPSGYFLNCNPMCKERWLPDYIYKDNFVICNELGILELGSISYKKETKVYLKNNGLLVEIGKLGETISLEMILTNIFAKNKDIAKKITLWEWISLVKPGGDWDYKHEKQFEKNNIFSLGNKLREEQGIYTKYQWKEHLFLDASDIGNFNFGYTGRFIGNVGFKRQTLNEYAGYLQTGKDILSIDNFLKGVEEFKQIHNNPPYGDEQDDYEWSNKGMDFAELDGQCACPKN